ncbi:MAG: NADH-quinone oxidoreductase subunit NuoG [Gammaproteobacteria bacterium]|nr:NADH-quinone oxidoreductase subunit NuoG [Gammaproteobacteria bacterium]
MIEIEIDGMKVSAEDGEMIIEAADRAQIYIPRFCYHKKLSIAANCRMCLVEVEGSRKPLPACATPVTPDMKVFTTSKVALESQRIVMEFLLINHPLDCPICDQGGQCELQDLAMGYGNAHSHYDEPKRSVYSEDIGPLIETELTRCIVCTRCVRFGEEVAGLRELGVLKRGEKAEIGTYVKHFLKSELSGNIIDICPVGALTDKPSRYQARAWEVQEHKSVSPHDCVGSNLYVHSRGKALVPDRQVYCVVPRENDGINETWISDRDRFGYEGLHSEERALHPRVKRGERWQNIDWRQALLEIADKTLTIVHEQSADEVCVLASPNSSTETFYLLQKMLRGLGSHHIDHRLRESDFSDQEHTPEFPDLGMTIAELEQQQAILLVGSNIRLEQPLLSNRLNNAAQNDAVIMALNLVDYDFVYPVQHKVIAHDIIQSLAQLADAIEGKAIANEQITAMAEQLKSNDRAVILLGAYAMQHPEAALIRHWVRYIAQKTAAKIGCATDGANSSGAWLAGAVPHRGVAGAVIENPGLDAKALLTGKPKRIYFLVNFEPELDTAYSEAALKTLSEAGMVVCLTPFVTKTMQTYADFILPIAPFTETDGCFVNIEGSWQHFHAVTPPKGDAKPAWKLVRALANFMQLGDFDYKSIHEIYHELRDLVGRMSAHTGLEVNRPSNSSSENNGLKNNSLVRLGEWPIYRNDNLVRRASALQKVWGDEIAVISINQKCATDLQLKQGETVTAIQGDSRVSLPLQIDNRLADDVVLLPSGLAQTAGFGYNYASISLEREAS